MIVKEMKKLSARITTAAGDVSAVKGNTIAEVLAFTRENLNVNADGTIKVSKILKPNLLKAQVDLANEQPSTELYTQLPYSFGLEEGKNYSVTYFRNNEAVTALTNSYTCKTVELSGHSFNYIGNEGSYGLSSSAGFKIIDKCAYDGTSFMPSSDSSVILISFSSTGGDTIIVSYTAVTEA